MPMSETTKCEPRNFQLKWKKSKDYCSSYDSNFIFCGKNIHLRISLVSDCQAIIALGIDREDELQTPMLNVGDEDSDLDNCLIKLQSGVQEALLKCFKTGKITLTGLLKNMGYSIPKKSISKV
jgi:hypothetical protein